MSANDVYGESNLFVSSCTLEWLIKLESSGEERIPMSEFGQMRGAPFETYAFFCDTFLSCVVGKIRYRRLVKGNPMTEVATISDEAFAHLLLENNFDRWVDIHKSRPIAHSLPGKKKRWESDVLPKYTVGGLAATGGSRKYKGWTNEGIARYNTLFAAVKADRRKNKNFDVQYGDAVKYKDGAAAAVRDGPPPPPTPRATHQLWENDSDTEDDDSGKQSDDRFLPAAKVKHAQSDSDSDKDDA